MRCERYRSEDDPPSWMRDSSPACVRPSCRALRSTALAPSCGHSSAWLPLLSACTEFALGKRRCGASWVAWASVRKSLRSAPLSETKTRYERGNAAPGLRLKKAQREGRLILFIDESGISERPTRVRTWGLKGQTPIIQFHFNWNHVSIIAGLSRAQCLFRLHEGSIKKEEIVEFLKALKAHLKRPLLIIWDGLRAHRSALASPTEPIDGMMPASWQRLPKA